MQLNLPGVKVREAVSWILDSENGGPKTYISEQSMKDRFPSLLEDLPLPNIDDSILNMWFGSSGTVTPLHFDGYHNIFLQIFGEKTFTLFDPRHTECIYPYTNDPKLSMISQVDVTRPDFVKFPRFREPLPIKVDLRPGDILFVPIYWWHFVIAKSMSISVSQWWMPENSADEIAMLALRKYAASAGNSTAIEL